MQGLEMLIVLLRNTATDSSFTCQLVPVMSHMVHSKIEIINNKKKRSFFSFLGLISAALSSLGSLREKWQVMERILF